MPNLLIPIKQTTDSISRRVFKSVIDNVIRITGMDVDRVELRGDFAVATQPGGELGDKGKTNRYLHQGRVIVTGRETYRDSEVINAATRHDDAQPIFEDRAIGVHIKPVYSYTDVELVFLYRAPSKQAVTAWRDDIKIRLADNRQQHLHELDYHFPVPPWCSGFLSHVFQRREAVGGYGDSFGDYLRSHYTRRATVVTAQDGDLGKSLLVIAERQIGVQGWFDFIEPVEEEKNDEGPSWNISFSYKFNYKKPVEVNAVYPLVIHNQLIDGKFIPKPVLEDPDKKLTYRGEFRLALDTFDYEARQTPRMLGGIMIPEFDEWIPESVPNFTTSFINWMTVIEPKDLQLFLNEQDILDTGFHPDILQYMRRNVKNLGRKGKCALHFALFRDTTMIADGDLDFTLTEKAFTVRSLSMPDIREKYHLRLSFCTNFKMYTEEALTELHEDGLTTLRMFQTVINKLDVEYAQAEHLNEDGELSIPYIKWFFKFLADKTIGYAPDSGMGGSAGAGNGGTSSSGSDPGGGTGPGRPGWGEGNGNGWGSGSDGNGNYPGNGNGNGNNGNGNGNGSWPGGPGSGNGGYPGNGNNNGSGNNGSGNGAPGTGTGSWNDQINDPSWFEDLSFHGKLDVPYVQVLTILVGRRPGA